MNLNDYQLFTRTTAVYPGANEHGFQEMNYLVLGLASEAGEVAGKLKKVIRGMRLNQKHSCLKSQTFFGIWCVLVIILVLL